MNPPRARVIGCLVAVALALGPVAGLGRAAPEGGETESGPRDELGRPEAREPAVEVPAPEETPEDWSRNGERLVHYTQDALSVRLLRVPLGEVLEEIGRQTGARIQGGLSAPREVSARFDGLPLHEALHRLLEGENFALVYGHDGGLRAVKLLGGPQAAPPATAPAAPIGTVLSIPALVQLLERQPPVAVKGRLEEELGTGQVSMAQIFAVIMGDHDAAVRLQAVRAGLQVVERPAVRDIVLATVKSLDAKEIAQKLRAAAGPQAIDVVMQMSTQARRIELRTKVSEVLQELRRPPP